MPYTDWQWGRIRARLITYYYHQKEDLIERIRMRAAIRTQETQGISDYVKSYTDEDEQEEEPDHFSKEGRKRFLKAEKKKAQLKENEAERQQAPTSESSSEAQTEIEELKEKRDSDGWKKVAFDILNSTSNNLISPASLESDESDWEIKGESLRRYYRGDRAAASRNTGGFATRTIPRPENRRVGHLEVAIHDFLVSAGYLTKGDLVEPDQWISPDQETMNVMGLSHAELRKSVIPHMLSRDYVSSCSEEEEFATALMSVYTKYSHENCKVRYITQGRFRTNATNYSSTEHVKRWSWYWGWLLFDSESSAIVKIIFDDQIGQRQFCFWLDKFNKDETVSKSKRSDIIDVSMSSPVSVQPSISDFQLIAWMRENYSEKRPKYRKFLVSKLKSLTYIINSYRFRKDTERPSGVLGYAETTEDEAEWQELSRLNERLAEIFKQKKYKGAPIEGEEKNMSKDEVYYRGYILPHWPGHPRHVMKLTLDEVVKAGRLGERLIETIHIGYPWHVDELIRLGADPNHTMPDSGGGSLHLIAASSTNGHLLELTKAVKETGKKLKFNVKAGPKQLLPSEIAALHCVNPEITEYLFAMEKLERDLGKGHLDADDLVPFVNGDFIEKYGYPLDGIGPEIYDDEAEEPETPGL